MNESGRKGLCPVCGHEAVFLERVATAGGIGTKISVFECPNDPEEWHQKIDHTVRQILHKFFFGIVPKKSLWTTIEDLEWRIESKKQRVKWLAVDHPSICSKPEELSKEILALEDQCIAAKDQITDILKTHCNKENLFRIGYRAWADCHFCFLEKEESKT